MSIYILMSLLFQWVAVLNNSSLFTSERKKKSDIFHWFFLRNSIYFTDITLGQCNRKTLIIDFYFNSLGKLQQCDEYTLENKQNFNLYFMLRYFEKLIVILQYAIELVREKKMQYIFKSMKTEARSHTFCLFNGDFNEVRDLLLIPGHRSLCI